MIPPEQIQEAINNLDLTDKQSIVDLMFCVQGDVMSCRAAADHIMKASVKLFEQVVFKCDGCQELATEIHFDADGVQLCSNCLETLEEEPPTTPPNTSEAGE